MPLDDQFRLPGTPLFPSERAASRMQPRTAVMDDLDFCDDAELGYRRSRTQFIPGAGLRFDENYRFAHLPLVAPEHPDVIALHAGARPGVSYAMGRHACTYSLVLPISCDGLLQSQAYRQLEDELKAAPFSPKLAWSLLPRRQQKLHATICAGVEEKPELDRDAMQAQAGFGPVGVEVRGLFSGNINVGRLYLRVYPERREGVNSFHAIQRRLGRPETDLYLVGLHNFTDHLDAGEASALAELLERWWDRPILRFRADCLWLLGASDDLVLDSNVKQAISFRHSHFKSMT